MDNSGVTLSLPTATSSLTDLSFPFQASSNLPLMLPTSHPSLNSGFFATNVDQMFPALDKTPLGSFDPVFEHIDANLLSQNSRPFC